MVFAGKSSMHLAFPGDSKSSQWCTKKTRSAQVGKVFVLGYNCAKGAAGHRPLKKLHHPQQYIKTDPLLTLCSFLAFAQKPCL